MPRLDTVTLDLAALALSDTPTSRPVALGELPGIHVLTAIRHRH
ncbi:MAG: hypothetical protein ACRDRN_13315 [Sciscionella sp.]